MYTKRLKLTSPVNLANLSTWHHKHLIQTFSVSFRIIFSNINIYKKNIEFEGKTNQVLLYASNTRFYAKTITDRYSTAK